MSADVWLDLEHEAREAFHGAGRFPLRAYSELMPSPYVGIKPYLPDRTRRDTTFCAAANALEIDEYEQAHDLAPGLDRIADHVIGELGKLMRGEAHALSQTLLADNPAWPPELAAAAKAGKLAHEPIVLAMMIALSRTQDDKGNDRWTLFGTSHDGAAALYRCVTEAQLGELVQLAGVTGSWRIVGPSPFAKAAYTELHGIDAIVTLEPFAKLPPEVRAAYLAHALRIVPTPASLVFFEHPGYRKLAAQLPRGTQIPLLHIFPRVERSCAIRIPQSGWLDEHDPGQQAHRVVDRIARTHRWQRVAKDQHVDCTAPGANAPVHGDGKYTDKVSVALFSTDPEACGLYDKPLARNCEVWTGDYELLLDGPRAGQEAIERAAGIVDAGGRFGYRMAYLPMRAGARDVFWHVPLLARRTKHVERLANAGYVTAERDGAAPLQLAPELLARPAHVAAATQFPHDAGHTRYTTSQNARKLLEFRALLDAPLSPELARVLLRTGKQTTLDAWLAKLPALAVDRKAGEVLARELHGCIGGGETIGEPIVLDAMGTRAFQEQIWHSIAGLAEGKFRQKSTADGIKVNRGKHGGPAAKAAHLHVHDRRDLDALADHFHERYRALIAANEMTGKAEVLDHRFRWETDFRFPWMGGWAANADAPHERNVVCVIPGNNRGEAVIMGDHYDTAYMEDVYDADVGGDMLRAPAQGADDNHSASTALLLAAEALLPLSRAGKLERDVWLIHLTGEEFPGDCLGARAIGQQLVEGTLSFTAEDGSARDVSQVRVAAVYVLDMIGHNTDRDRDVFQIAPGEGAGSARLAQRAHHATERWNRRAREWNRAHPGLPRAQRMPDGSAPPPPFAHLPLHGEIRVEWEPASALYNTDGQIFSDLGVPVVLFMENYDITRKGYHDTHDTMENIDLDYCAALTAIAIETVADTACAK